MLIKTSVLNRLPCLVASPGTIFFSSLPVPNCFLTVCFLTLVAAASRAVFARKLLAVSGRAFPNISATTCLAIETTHFYKRKNYSFTNNLWKCAQSSFRPSKKTLIATKLYLCWSNDPVASFFFGLNNGSFPKQHKKSLDTVKCKRFFRFSFLSNQSWSYAKTFWSAV